MRRAAAAFAACLSVLGMLGARSSGEVHALLIASCEYDPALTYVRGDGARRPLSDFNIPSARNDIRMMASALEWRYGVARRNMRILGIGQGAAGAGYVYMGPRSTRVAIQRAIEAAVAATRPGGVETLVVYFSGHGRQQFDPSEDDSASECIATWDNYNVLDDEIHYWLSRARARRVVRIMDACYSGGMSKQAQGFGANKTMPVPARTMGAWGGQEADTSEPEAPRLSPGGKHILFAACPSNGLATVRPVYGAGPGEDRMASPFTTALHYVLLRTPRSLTWSELSAAVRRRMRLASADSDPHLEGALPGETAIAAARPATCPTFGVSSGVLNAGRAAGIRVGMQLASLRSRDGRSGIGPANLYVTAATWLSARVAARGAMPTYAAIAGPGRLTMPAVSVSMPAKGGLQLPARAGVATTPADEPADLVLYVPGSADGRASAVIARPGGAPPMRVEAPNRSALAGRAQAAIDAFRLQRALLEAPCEVHPLGLRLSSNLGPDPICRTGQSIEALLQAGKRANILLLALEADGRTTVLVPTDEQPVVSLQAGRTISRPLRIQPPAGDTVLLALASPKLARMPAGLLARVEGQHSPVIAPGREEAFLRWLSGLVGDPAVPFDAALMVVTAVER